MKKVEPKSLYFVGIKGIAMAGVAVMAKTLGYDVKGSDESTVFPNDSLLHDHGIEIFEGFDGANLKYKPDLVIVSAAYGLQNPEVKAAKSLRLTTIPMSEMLAKIMSKYEGVGVAGVHGKTTTTAMLAKILSDAGYSPSYMIGTDRIDGLPGSAHIGGGKYFVAEADEYKKSETNHQPKFLDLPIKHLIITSIELDHPDVYATAEQVYSAFYQLTTKIPRDGTIVACVDWPLVRRLANRRVDRNCLTYGFDATARYQIVTEATGFSIKVDDQVIGPINLAMPGRHNMLNATAAIIMAMQLGVTKEPIIKTLESFKGPSRRFQRLGDVNGAHVYDDYAHHPTALNFLLETAKKQFPKKRLVVVFQPHTYSRTGKLLKEFAEALRGADKLILLNIWASSREKSGYVTIKDLIDEVRKYKPDVEYRSTVDEVAVYLTSFLTDKDVVFLVGAGDVYKVFDKITGR